jgi:WD40 repeat protein
MNRISEVRVHRILKGHRQSVYTACRGGSSEVYSAGGDGYIVRWKPESQDDGLVIASLPEPVYTLCYDNANKRLYAGSKSGYLYSIEGGEARNFTAHTNGLFAICKTETGFLTGGGDGRIIRWTNHLEVISSLKVSDKSIRKIIAIPGGYACACSDGNIYLLSSEPALAEIISHHDNTVFALEWLPERKHFISGGRDALLRLSDPGKSKPEIEIKAHLLHIHDIQLSPSGKLIASASMDKTVKIWDAGTIQLLKVLDQPKFGVHTASVNSLVWLNDQLLISASDDRTLVAWEIAY